MSRKQTPPDRPAAQHRSGADEPTGETTGSDDQPEHERVTDADADSEALTGLRARMHRDYARRQQYGPLGRSL
ncbi:hypothetical protein [Streptomyces sioyaensis]|uniref:hypothetical protein n=1 Tax=Streptomyces sioyaensis TaxID=67364 RepID=UPI00378ED3B0